MTLTQILSFRKEKEARKLIIAKARLHMTANKIRALRSDNRMSRLEVLIYEKIAILDKKVGELLDADEVE